MLHMLTNIIAIGSPSVLGLITFSLGYTNSVQAGNNDNLAANPEFGPSSLSDFSFVTAGDFGCKDEAERTVNNMINKNPDFGLVLGDLSYERNATCWLEIVSPLDTPGKIRITIGDHDIDPYLSRYNQYLTHFNLTKPYYSFV